MLIDEFLKNFAEQEKERGTLPFGEEGEPDGASSP